LGEAVWSEVSKGKLQLPTALKPVLGGLEVVTGKIQEQKAQLDDLLASWKTAGALSGPLSVFRALESRQARRSAQRAAGSADALAVLQTGQSRTGLSTAWRAWQAARAWQRERQ
jgi:phytoene synthase